MADIAPAFLNLNPSYTFPELLLPYYQASGAFDLLPKGKPEVRLSDGDLMAYINRVDVRTRMSAAQAAGNQLPSCSVAISQISTATYLQRVRAEYDHHDTAAMARRGISIVEAQRLAMRQGHFQLLRVALLYGYNPAAGEGLLNTAGATAVNLPPDPFGNTTVVTYDNGGMAFYLAQQVQQIKTRTNQLGIAKKFVILGPQRVLGLFEYNVVQLTQYQREGAGSQSTAGVLKDILEMNGDEILWCYDDTLIGKGAGGTDAVIIVMPELSKPDGGTYDTNEFSKLAPGMPWCTMQVLDMAAPKEIPTPIPGGAIDIVSELRTSSGWGIRPEAVEIVSMIYQ